VSRRKPPELSVGIDAAPAGAGAKMAVTVIGPFTVTVVEAEVEEATGPVQPAKTNPGFGVARRDTTVPGS
jgi:predicted RNA methylase